MKRLIRRAASMLLLMGFASHVDAGIIFESGTLGETGVTWQQALDEEVPAVSVSDTVYTGVRFELTQPVAVSQIGGHFFSPSGGDFFGAIVALDDENDFPDSGDLSTPDVLGHTELAFPLASKEILGELDLHLNSGWYAIIFGSGLFDMSGAGGMPINNTNTSDPAYLIFQPKSGVDWVNFTSLDKIHRFVVRGRVVPEPTAITYVSLACLVFLIHRKFR